MSKGEINDHLGDYAAATTFSACHRPVFLDFLLKNVLKKTDKWFFDGTLGEGGHSEALLQRGLRGVGFDRDSAILQVSLERLDFFIGPQKAFFPFCANFSQVKTVLADFPPQKSQPAFDLILLDLGISRYHYFYSGRGFSFQQQEPLDMRLDAKKCVDVEEMLAKKSEKSAGGLVNHAAQDTLADIFYHYGEMRNAKKIASVLVAERKKNPIVTAKQLADIIAAHSVLGKKSKIHPATLAFQALRIYVNQEFSHLTEGIKSLVPFLSRGGRLAIITYHSLEDRIVKKTFYEYLKKRENSNKYKKSQMQKNIDQERIFGENDQKTDDFFLFSKKVIKPQREEVQSNPAARSAKLRILVRNSEDKR